MPMPKTSPPRYDPSARNWAFERRVALMMEQTDFLAFDEPEQMPPDIIQKMLYDFEQNRIPDAPRNREMFLETLQLQQELRELGIVPEQVAPTKDGRGYVRLGFEDVFKLLDLIPEETPDAQ